MLPEIIQEWLCKGHACNLAISDRFARTQFRVHRFSDQHAFALSKLHRRVLVRSIPQVFNLKMEDFRHALSNRRKIPEGHSEHLVFQTNAEEYWLT
jgi:hypothetical protein